MEAGTPTPSPKSSPLPLASLNIAPQPLEGARRLLHEWQPRIWRHCTGLCLPAYSGIRGFRFEAHGFVLRDLSYAHQHTDEITGVSGGGSTIDPVVLQYVLTGWIRFENRISAFTLEPGKLLIRDTATPWRFLVGHATVSRWMTVPRPLLAHHLGGSHVLRPYVLCDLADPQAHVLISYLETLRNGDAVHALCPAGRQAAQEAALCLLGGVVSERGTTDSQQLGTAIVAVAKRTIDRHLDDPSLSPAAIAAALGVSVRTLHRSFAAEGETPMAYLRRRRLGAARDELARAGTATRIADVAAHWKFSDASHFTRQFKEAYGTTPTTFLRHV